MSAGGRRAAWLAAVLAVVAVAAGLRLEGVRWDDGYLLHPDERFLLMRAEDARLPEDLAGYFRGRGSPLDPRRHGDVFYVYGTLPLTLLVAADALVQTGDWAGLAVLARRLAAAADLGTTALVVALAGLLARREGRGPAIAPVAGLLYALAVLPVQAAHFFTCDPFQVFFGTAALLLAVLAGDRRSFALTLAAGLALGLAVACKLPGLLVAPLVAGLLALTPPRAPGRGPAQRAGVVGAAWALVALGAYLGLRLGDPVFFESASWLDPRPSGALRADLAELARLSGPDSGYPPALQWIDRTPGLYLLGNLAWFGLGLAGFMFAVLGVASGLGSRRPARTLAAAWVLAAFVLFSLRFVQSIRYLLPLLPVLMLLAAFPVEAGLRRLRPPPVRVAAAATLLALLALWPLAFRSIYQEPHPRVRASRWIRAHVAPGSTLAVEHWDDRLPLSRPGEPPRYAFRELPVFLPDGEAKWRRMDAGLAEADLLVLSSRRAHASIRRLPERYPRTARFYADLFAGRTAFEKVAQFTSFPTLFGVALDDRRAEEAFTVYDHPAVTIFRRRRTP